MLSFCSLSLTRLSTSSASANEEAPAGRTKGASWFKKLNILNYFDAAAKRKAVANKGPVSVGRRPAVPLSLHALVVGVNSYQNLETLNGAAEDAREFAAYLQQDLAAPSDSNADVTILTDEKATRAAFIEGLNSLANNRAIKADDPIVIYFAGHITDEGDSEVPGLLLYDWSTQRAVESISSRELHELLAQIQKRSDNVTVIVDGRPSKQLGQTRGSGSRKPVPGTSSPQATPKPGDQAIRPPCIIVSCSKGETGREDRGLRRITAACLWRSSQACHPSRFSCPHYGSSSQGHGYQPSSSQRSCDYQDTGCHSGRCRMHDPSLAIANPTQSIGGRQYSVDRSPWEQHSHVGGDISPNSLYAQPRAQWDTNGHGPFPFSNLPVHGAADPSRRRNDQSLSVEGPSVFGRCANIAVNNSHIRMDVRPLPAVDYGVPQPYTHQLHSDRSDLLRPPASYSTTSTPLSGGPQSGPSPTASPPPNPPPATPPTAPGRQTAALAAIFAMVACLVFW
ncbi:hypothetical protein BKA70DRAFT_77417 [Coprinopsis sp. MPI-PUGE-AT-0042]|nr:hypothetical protein BKA70DRAFT_77417 [Coprinopsis sp. MPI-PUGE-AT-0042]